MKNTLLQNVISNFDLMDGQHFLDWFDENRKWMLAEEEKQIKEAYKAGEINKAEGANQYFDCSFNRYLQAE